MPLVSGLIISSYIKFNGAESLDGSGLVPLPDNTALKNTVPLTKEELMGKGLATEEENISALVNVSFCDTEAVMFKYPFSKDSETKLRLKNHLCEPVIKLVNIGAGGVLNPSLQSIGLNDLL